MSLSGISGLSGLSGGNGTDPQYGNLARFDSDGEGSGSGYVNYDYQSVAGTWTIYRDGVNVGSTPITNGNFAVGGDVGVSYDYELRQGSLVSNTLNVTFEEAVPYV